MSIDLQYPTGFADRVRTIAHTAMPHITVNLDDSSGSSTGRRGSTSYIQSYSTGDEIKGHVFISTPPDRDVAYDQLEIAFVGSTKTYTEHVSAASAASNRIPAFHEFLKMLQPREDMDIPDYNLPANQSYRIPFNFVVPKTVLPGPCKHSITSEKLRDAHQQLPPSLGEPDVAGRGAALLDDLTPHMARVRYCIRVRLIKHDRSPSILCDKIRKIRVIPATDEQPPVDVDGTDGEYCMRHDRWHKKGLLRKKVGRLSMEAPQPASFRLPHPAEAIDGQVSTMATVVLRYDPLEPDSLPPPLKGLKAQLKVATFFSSSARTSFPSKNHLAWDTTQGLYVEAMNLSSRDVQQPDWQRHDPGTDASALLFRRTSSMSIAGTVKCPQPSKAYNKDLPFYTAQFPVPIALPSNKTFIPTFHSCLVSRIYVLDLKLTIPSGILNKEIYLKLPVQISSEGHPQVDGRGSQSLQDEAEVPASPEDEFFAPRSIAPPESRLHNPSIPAPSAFAELPPDYDAFAPRGGRMPSSHRHSLRFALPLVT